MPNRCHETGAQRKITAEKLEQSNLSDHIGVYTTPQYHFVLLQLFGFPYRQFCYISFVAYRGKALIKLVTT